LSDRTTFRISSPITACSRFSPTRPLLVVAVRGGLLFGSFGARRGFDPPSRRTCFRRSRLAIPEHWRSPRGPAHRAPHLRSNGPKWLRAQVKRLPLCSGRGRHRASRPFVAWVHQDLDAGAVLVIGVVGLLCERGQRMGARSRCGRNLNLAPPRSGILASRRIRIARRCDRLGRRRARVRYAVARRGCSLLIGVLIVFAPGACCATQPRAARRGAARPRCGAVRLRARCGRGGRGGASPARVDAWFRTTGAFRTRGAQRAVEPPRCAGTRDRPQDHAGRRFGIHTPRSRSSVMPASKHVHVVPRAGSPRAPRSLRKRMSDAVVIGAGPTDCGRQHARRPRVCGDRGQRPRGAGWARCARPSSSSPASSTTCSARSTHRVRLARDHESASGGVRVAVAPRATRARRTTRPRYVSGAVEGSRRAVRVARRVPPRRRRGLAAPARGVGSASRSVAPPRSSRRTPPITASARLAASAWSDG